jgi:hypothetical protein
MNKQQQIEERLWDHIDGVGSAEERSLVEDLIAGNEEWQTMYRQLLEIQDAMNSEEMEMPSLRFTRNVMEEIARTHIAPASNSYINKTIIRGIAAFFLTTIGATLIYLFTQIRFSGSYSSGPVLNYSREVQDRLNSFNWGRLFDSTSINIFLMVNLVLGLMLLNMWLEKKKRHTGASI